MSEPDPADRRLFALGDAAWDEFNKALDRPAVHKPDLTALLAEESPFEDES